MIVALEEAKHELVALRPEIKELGSALRIEALAAKTEELEQLTLDPDFWSKQETSSKVLQTIKQNKDTIEGYHVRVELICIVGNKVFIVGSFKLADNAFYRCGNVYLLMLFNKEQELVDHCDNFANRIARGVIAVL